MASENPSGAGTLAQLSALAFVNHLLRTQTWAPRRLAPFAGKAVRVRGLPLPFAAAIREDGTLTAAPETAPDVTLSASAGVLLRLLAGDSSAAGEVAATGDAALAAEIGYVARNLRWDAEADLAYWLGDIPAHRLARLGRDLLGWPGPALSGLARSWAEYLTEERPLLAKAAAVTAFVGEVDELRDRTERLEKRLRRLAGK